MLRPAQPKNFVLQRIRWHYKSECSLYVCFKEVSFPIPYGERTVDDVTVESSPYLSTLLNTDGIRVFSLFQLKIPYLDNAEKAVSVMHMHQKTRILCIKALNGAVYMTLHSIVQKKHVVSQHIYVCSKEECSSHHEQAVICQVIDT